MHESDLSHSHRFLSFLSSTFLIVADERLALSFPVHLSALQT